MWDGAPCHTARLIKNWFDFVQEDYIKEWPGNSPNLNPTEKSWVLTKNKLCDSDTSSIPKLEVPIQDIWNGTILTLSGSNILLSLSLGTLTSVSSEKGAQQSTY